MSEIVVEMILRKFDLAVGNIIREISHKRAAAGRVERLSIHLSN